MQKQNRLRDRRDFRRVFKHGKSVANRHFVVYKKSKRISGVRIGISVSKKVAKHAVDRNRMKRLIKEVLRQWIEQLPPDCDLVIIARGSSVHLGYKQVEQSLRHLFSKAKLLTR